MLVRITVDVTLSDATSGPAGYMLTAVTSDEPDAGASNEDLPNDIQGWDVGTADTSGEYRAERADAGDGRVYTLTYTGEDVAGNEATCKAVVRVPKNQKPRR
jgi:hypothetical protein